MLTAAGHRLPAPVSPEERVLGGDLREDAVVDAALAGADAVIHLAGSSVEKPLAEIIQNNLVALQRLYEGARRHQVKRIVFASSNHTIGMYPAGQRLTLADKVRPDGNYGLSKVWGEAMGQLYFDKFGIETVSLRIGSAIERPIEPRHLSTWLGYDDLEDLVWRAATVPDVGCLTVWGVSANTRSWWDNAEAAALGYAPKQNAEDYAEAILRGHDPGWRFQGGSFALADVT
ncbi:NAD(P)-dependent oxidoreductase [Acidocella sp. MX-AZ03]|uniref:NAD-dependent epimerase/dehydratase family protein n=1 Tax=Acidocella sp. MX-AZ03 TaxID=2697363 RepID=UPI0022DE3EA6|nr:NAD(P)-dependent oxidoreductase [Acidocella sp. MX-AZ03]WBO60070.1 NAD(P)-dependent oxidoreductase [Acidocella sp. MX-AZ03]